MKLSPKTMTKSSWSYLFFLIFLQPAWFQHMNLVSRLFDMAHIVMFLVMVYFQFFAGRKKTRAKVFKESKICILLIAYYAYLILITILRRGRVSAMVYQGLQFTAFCMYLDLVMKNNPKTMFRAPLNILTTYLVLNLISLYMFPDGLYETTYFKNNFFFGYDNQNINFILPTMVLVLLKHQCDKPCRTQIILTYAVAIITAITIWSGMTLVVVTVMTVFAIFCLRRKGIMMTRLLNGRIFNFYSLLITNVAFFVGLVFFQIQYYFEYIIVVILKKNMTLTSRTVIWPRVIDFIEQNPIFGYGKEHYGPRALKMGYRDTHPCGLHAHNRYLETMYMGGVILTGLLVAMLLRAAKKLYEVKDTSFAKILSFSIFVYLCGMLTELYDYCLFLWGFLVMAENAKQLAK